MDKEFMAKLLVIVFPSVVVWLLWGLDRRITKMEKTLNQVLCALAWLQGNRVESLRHDDNHEEEQSK